MAFFDVSVVASPNRYGKTTNRTDRVRLSDLNVNSPP
jgi:hypothetical protein